MTVPWPWQVWQGRLDWIVPASSAANGQRYVKVPYWLPAGLTAILPAFWLIRRRGRAYEG